MGYGLNSGGVYGHTLKGNLDTTTYSQASFFWSIFRYNALIVTQIILLDFGHGIGLNVIYCGQKMVTVTVF